MSMTVAEVWGRVQAQAVLPIAHEGDTWLFQVPRSMVGRVTAEFWVKDEAGNIGYKAAILTIEHGTIKCIEWLKTGDILSLPIDRPIVTSLPFDRGISEVLHPEIEDVSEYPTCIELPHVCIKMEV